MSKIATEVSSIVLTGDVPSIGLGVDRTGKVVSADGGIAEGVSAQSGVTGDTIRIDHGPLLEALSGAAIDPAIASNTTLMWNASGKLVPYVAGANASACGTLAQGQSATAANQWVRFYPKVFK